MRIAATLVAGDSGAGCRCGGMHGPCGQGRQRQRKESAGGYALRRRPCEYQSDHGLGSGVAGLSRRNHGRKDKEDNKSADVHLGFGEFQMRVRAVSYESSDPQDKVLAFYRKALNRYGDVITCQDNAPVGSPAATSEGLTCNDDKNPKVKIGDNDNGIKRDSLQLKAGSKRHQHILGFEDNQGGKTRFALVALDLPAGVVEPGNGKSD